MATIMCVFMSVKVAAAPNVCRPASRRRQACASGVCSETVGSDIHAGRRASRASTTSRPMRDDTNEQSAST